MTIVAHCFLGRKARTSVLLSNRTQITLKMTEKCLKGCMTVPDFGNYSLGHNKNRFKRETHLCGRQNRVPVSTTGCPLNIFLFTTIGCDCRDKQPCTSLLNILYNLIKYHDSILKGYRVMACTRFNSYERQLQK